MVGGPSQVSFSAPNQGVTILEGATFSSCCGDSIMTITVEAVFKNGTFRFKKPVRLADGTVVRVTITPVDEDYDPLDAVIGICKGGPRDGADKHDQYIYGDSPS
jgi:predicted DNA-binding antitoxin AbrB/MazE fold protein